MKIVLATCGSRGDVQPMIALSLALKSAGHDVLLAGPPEKAGWAKKMGCPYQGFGRDVTAFIDGMENVLKPRMHLAFYFFLQQELRRQFKVLPPIVKNADLVIGSSLTFALSSIAQAMNIPYRYIAFTPQLFPSAFHPFPTIKTQTRALWYNRATWKSAILADRFTTTFLVNQQRKKMGLAPIDGLLDHILGDRTIVACDKQIARVPPDVAKKTVQTGYLHLDIPDVSLPSLDKFLMNGSKPLYAGFGSMPQKDQVKNIPLLEKVAEQVDKRMVIAAFWRESSGPGASGSIFYIKSYPHLNLFPETCAVIHHGGAGTTATAAVSGVPQVIVPHILDQFYHGRQIQVQGLGAAPVRRSELSAKRLAVALKSCLESRKIQEMAQQTGRAIDPEKSLKRAVKTIEHSFG